MNFFVLLILRQKLRFSNWILKRDFPFCNFNQNEKFMSAKQLMSLDVVTLSLGDRNDQSLLPSEQKCKWLGVGEKNIDLSLKIKKKVDK